MSDSNKSSQQVPGYGKVAVLMGGDSAEREVSLETGRAIHAALCRQGVDAHQFDTREQTVFDLVEQKFNRAFVALHGRGGEDGVIQGALQILGIPYTGSGVMASALAMDKVRSKQIWKASGLPTAEFIEIESESDLERIQTELGFPVMVKPVHEGSSCGATKVNKADQLQAAWQKARNLDTRVLVERWITGAEYTAAILGHEVLPMIRLETPREFYDYEAKYIESTTRYICPAGLNADKEQQLAAIVLAAFDAIGATGWGRVDLMVDSSGNTWLIELNTVPGMTSHSLVPMSAKQAGLDFDALVLRILQSSMKLGSMSAGQAV